MTFAEYLDLKTFESSCNQVFLREKLDHLELNRRLESFIDAQMVSTLDLFDQEKYTNRVEQVLPGVLGGNRIFEEADNRFYYWKRNALRT